jgi:sugar/nucleoside kinase (ribokinase family)
MDGHEFEAAEMALERFPNLPSVLDAGSLRDSTIILSKKASHIIASSTFATEISESENPEDGLKCLSDRAPFAAITQGNKGVLWKDNQGNSGRIQAADVNAIDTTGAGDIFHGAFSLALSKGKSFPGCLSWANQVAAISVKRLGGRTSCPTINEIPSLDTLE